MRTRLIPRHVLSVLVICTLSVGCLCTDPVDGSRYFCFGEASEAEEIALGRQYAPAFIVEAGGAYPEPAIYDYLNGQVMEMARISHRPELPWSFTILNTSQINAFALPGGQVFVTRGMLNQLESEAQFMHLMGHEIGHVSHRHAYRGQGRAALVGLFSGLAAFVEQSTISDPDDPLVIAPLIAGGLGLLNLKYSRDQELESDERGVDYALKAGYDPREGTKTFEMFLALKQQAGGGESLIDGLLSTHPLDSTRIERINTYIDETYPSLPANLEVSEPSWSGVVQTLRYQQPYYEKLDRALALIEEAREGESASKLAEARALLREGSNALPGHAPFAVGLGVVALTENNSTLASREFRRAVDLDPKNFLGQLYLGVVAQRDQEWPLAITSYRAAHEVHPTHPMPCYFLGESFEASGDLGNARQWYGAAIERSPAGSELASRARAKIEALPSA